MQKRLTQLFSIGSLVVWIWIFASSLLVWPHNSAAALVLGIGGAVLVSALAFFGGPLLDKLSARSFRTLSAALFAAYGAFLVYMAVQLQVVPIMDMEVVIRSIPDFLDNGSPQVWSGYYVVCNNNLGLALLLSGLYAMLGLFGIAPGTPAGHLAGTVFSSLFILLTVFLCCWCALRIWRSRQALALAFVLCAGFAPFVLWSSTYYSDTLSAPFFPAILLLWTFFRDAKRQPGRIALLTAMGVVTFLGFALKGSIAVALVALLILLFLTLKPRKAALYGLVLAAAFALPLAGYRVWQQGYLDWSVQDAIAYPTELWFAYGSEGDGNYSQDIVDAANALPDMESRRAMLRQRIVDNYTSRTLPQQFQFFSRKLGITWGNGLYDAQEFLQTPSYSNWTHFFILPGQPGFMPLTYYCQGYLLMIQLLLLAGAALDLKKGPAAPITLARLCLVGGILFLSFWETKARYAFNFTPLMLLLAVGGVLALTASLAGIKARRSETNTA